MLIVPPCETGRQAGGKAGSRLSQIGRDRYPPPQVGRLSQGSRQVVARYRGRLSLNGSRPKTTASPCLPLRRLLVFKRLEISLQRDSSCQGSGRRGSNPRQPAWKAGCHCFCARLLRTGFIGSCTPYKRNVSVPDKRCRARFLALSAKDVA